MKLTIKQTIALDLLEDLTTNEILFGGGAGGGKSALGCYWITKCCLKFSGSRWVIGRNTLKTLKETTLNTLWEVFRKQGVKVGLHYTYNENRGIIKFFNGSEILLKDLAFYPADADFDELGSLEITGAFVDECNQIVLKAWDILKSRIRYKLDAYCHVCGNQIKKMIVYDKDGIPLLWTCENGHQSGGLVPKQLGTCNPAKNWVYQRFYLPCKMKILQLNRAFIQALLADNKNTSKHYRENLLTLDKNSKERLLYGNWEYDDDPTVLCDYDAISDLFQNQHVKPIGERFISADLAMQGRDKFVSTYWSGLVCKIDLVRAKSDGKQIETDLQEQMIERSVPRSRCVADSDGMGNYLESYLRGIKTFHGNAKATLEEYMNLKSQCAFKLAELINDRAIRIICTEEEKLLIIEELGVLKRDAIDNDTQKKRIISKEKMKELLGRSPDFLDALIMRMYFEVQTEIYGYAV